jgi:hypothetical protein
MAPLTGLTVIILAILIVVIFENLGLGGLLLLTAAVVAFVMFVGWTVAAAQKSQTVLPGRKIGNNMNFDSTIKLIKWPIIVALGAIALMLAGVTVIETFGHVGLLVFYAAFIGIAISTAIAYAL